MAYLKMWIDLIELTVMNMSVYLQTNFTADENFLPAILTTVRHVFSPIELPWNLELLRQPFQLHTCLKCNNEGHYADRWPEFRINSASLLHQCLSRPLETDRQLP